VHLDVDPPLEEEHVAAIGRALAEAGIRLDELPEPYLGEWRRTAACEAVDSEHSPVDQAPSPRSTRGATRA
jgi:hypothetical protein